MPHQNAQSSSPTVSVIIPCYNQGQFVDEAIDSVLDSTFVDLEIIVVNDGSIDPETIERLSNLDRPKTRVISQANAGLSAARNAGFAQSRGRYLLTLDADDAIEPTYVEKAVQILDKEPDLGFVYSDLRLFGDESGERRLSSYNFYRMLWDNRAHGCALIRRTAWQEAGGFDETMREGYEDWDFWIRLGKRGWYGYRIPELLFRYRQHGVTMRRRSNRRRRSLIARLRANHPDIFDDDDCLKRIAREWKVSRCAVAAETFLREAFRSLSLPASARVAVSSVRRWLRA